MPRPTYSIVAPETTRPVGAQALLSVGDTTPQRSDFTIKTLRRSLNVVSQMLLPERHSYRWIALDPSYPDIVIVTLRQPYSASSENLTLTPGGWLPIPGTAIYVISTGAITTADEAKAAGSPGAPLTTFWLTEAETPPPMPAGRALYYGANSMVPGAAEPAALGDGVPILPGYDRLVIGFLDDSGAATPVVAGESSSHEVWFMMWPGGWRHNPADDFDAAGLGIASRDHSYESYELTGSERRFYVRRIDPTVLWFQFSQSKVRP